MHTGASAAIMYDDIRGYYLNGVTPYGGHILRSANGNEISAIEQCTSNESFEERASVDEFVVVRYRSHGVII